MIILHSLTATFVILWNEDYVHYQSLFEVDGCSQGYKMHGEMYL
jgi:hypothetical protein